MFSFADPYRNKDEKFLSKDVGLEAAQEETMLLKNLLI